jgi:hypothetical protein
VGQITLLMGEPGVGKSLFAMDVIARATRGLRGPFDQDPGEPASVILFAGEDEFATTVRSRLKAAGADDARVELVQNDLDLNYTTYRYERELIRDHGDISSLESAGKTSQFDSRRNNA